MLIIAAACTLPSLLWLFISLVAAAARIWRGGATEAQAFDRAEFTLACFLNAEVDEQDGGSLISTRTGIGVCVRNAKFEVRQTGTISNDIF